MASRSASSGAIPALDHLILLVNDPRTASSQIDSALERAICTFSALGFQVVRGGLHADGITSNALIVFPDGVYIELVQFEAAPGLSSGEKRADFEARRKRHWWYNSRPGWIDWCLQDGISDGMIQSINDNAHRLRQTAHEEEQRESQDGMRIVAPRLQYLAPQEGGRVTMTGEELRWKVSFPAPPEGSVGNPRSAVPFWCADLTARQLRVPLTRSMHENRSPGIAEITLLYARDTVAAYLDVSLALNQPIDAATLPISSELQLVPNQIPHRLLAAPAPAPKPDTTLAKGEGHPHHQAQMPQRFIRVVVKVAEDPQDFAWIERHGEGLYEVAIYGACPCLAREPCEGGKI